MLYIERSVTGVLGHDLRDMKSGKSLPFLAINILNFFYDGLGSHVCGIRYLIKNNIPKKEREKEGIHTLVGTANSYYFGFIFFLLPCSYM